MAQNTQPIYPLIGDTSVDNGTTMAPTLTTAAADYTGISANNALVFTADATNGSIVKYIRFKAIGTNTQSVARIYINNGSTPTTATNNTFYDEIQLPATTATNTATTATIDYVFPYNGLVLKAGWRIYVGLATTVAAGWRATGIGAEF